MLTWLRWLVPDLLTERLGSLTPTQAHRLGDLLGITDGVHDWLEGMCPCQQTGHAGSVTAGPDECPVSDRLVPGPEVIGHGL